MSETYNNIAKRHRMAHLVRKQAQPYLRSNKKYDQDQGRILEAIADDLVSNDAEMACLRMDSLHSDIKGSLPFQVLDFLNKAELGLDR